MDSCVNRQPVAADQVLQEGDRSSLISVQEQPVTLLNLAPAPQVPMELRQLKEEFKDLEIDVARRDG